MSQRLPVPALILLLLSAHANAQELSILGYTGDRRGEVLILETSLDMERGFDRRSLITCSSPDNQEKKRRRLLEEGRALRLQGAGDWELFRALEDRALDKALERARDHGFSPPTVQRELRGQGATSFSFTWDDDPVELLLVPGRRHTELMIRRGSDGSSRRLARIPRQQVPGPDGPEDLGANQLFEVALLHQGRLLAVVVGAWDPEGGRRVGWEQVLLLPLRKTARLWKLPHPLKPKNKEWKTP